MSLLHRLVPGYESIDQEFQKLGPAGYTVAINITNTTPEFYHTTLPDDWVEEYTTKKYAFLDPVMQFAAFSTGVKRWSEIKFVKLPVFSEQVFERAAAFRLNFGIGIVKKGSSGRRKKHLLSLARPDRELTDEEIVHATQLFEQILNSLAPNDHLSERQLQILSLFARGKTREAVAEEMRLSVPTIRNEIAAVRQMWGADNVTEVVGIACARRLIAPHDEPKW